MSKVIALHNDDDLVAAVAVLLADARHAAGLSQRDLASIIGVSHAMINTYEAGRRHPTITTLCRLLAGTGVTVHLELGQPPESQPTNPRVP